MKRKGIILLLTAAIVGGLLCGCREATSPAEEAEAGKTVESEADVNTSTNTDNDDAQSNATEAATEAGPQTTLTYIGHASVKIVAKDGTVIYIDPNYSKGDYTDEADYILVTHAHDDHQPCDAVKLKEGGTLIKYNQALHQKVYESYDFGNIKIQAVAAGGNINHSILDCVGYVITVDDIKIYHAGDTSMLDQMAELTDLNIDYAMYPIDGVYNMDAVEATAVANLVAAKNNIPIHELDEGKTKKSDSFTPEGRLVLEYGQTIVLN